MSINIAQDPTVKSLRGIARYLGKDIHIVGVFANKLLKSGRFSDRSDIDVNIEFNNIDQMNRYLEDLQTDIHREKSINFTNFPQTIDSKRDLHVLKVKINDREVVFSFK